MSKPSRPPTANLDDFGSHEQPQIIKIRLTGRRCRQLGRRISVVVRGHAV
jgi:hypothetical protein